MFGETVLHEAACQGNAAIVRLLLSHWADPLTQNENGQSALQFAQGAAHRVLSETPSFPSVPAILAHSMRQCNCGRPIRKERHGQSHYELDWDLHQDDCTAVKTLFNDISARWTRYVHHHWTFFPKVACLACERAQEYEEIQRLPEYLPAISAFWAVEIMTAQEIPVHCFLLAFDGQAQAVRLITSWKGHFSYLEWDDVQASTATAIMQARKRFGLGRWLPMEQWRSTFFHSFVCLCTSLETQDKEGFKDACDYMFGVHPQDKDINIKASVRISQIELAS
eukprot:gnl/MRDRNA2_/MRDRNA2_131213_c0_seq1.p1 gnl/MRDRNA2_/MRDRNA2_131213_c0~~gnl/MRDRNA2_/MRDRNA2_131213_c0_seq1.p1  ORF type:complete len:287 (-),score=31.46 gnl/MRDRNA2_/MRDRNA2_131213_c0_seq1:297-1136(-)